MQENQVKKSNGFAITGFVCSFLIPLLGLIFSIIGLNKAKETNSGKGLSIAGIIISAGWMVLSLIIVIFTYLIAAPSVLDTINNAKCSQSYGCVDKYDGTKECFYYNSETLKEEIITCD